MSKHRLHEWAKRIVKEKSLAFHSYLAPTLIFYDSMSNSPSTFWTAFPTVLFLLPTTKFVHQAVIFGVSLSIRNTPAHHALGYVDKDIWQGNEWV